MTGFVYSIVLKIAGQNSVSKAVDVVDKLDSSVNRAGNSASRAGGKMRKMGNDGSNAFSRIQSGVTRLLTSLAIMSATMSSLNASADLEGFQNAINFASGQDGAKNIEMIYQTVEALGTPLKASFNGFKNLQGGVMGTGVTAQQTRDIFWSVSEAASAMALSGDDANGVFLALSQIASKGKVQAEELRGQLGERLPGAFNIAARAMNVSTAQLDKMLERGEVMADDFLPRFAKELHSTFGGAVATSANSARANFNRFNNAVFHLQDTFGRLLLPTVTSLINDYFIPAVGWISENIKVVGLLAASFGGLWLGMKAYNLMAFTSILFTKGFSAAMSLLNKTMMANPIGLVLGLLVTLGSVVVYAWNKFEGFRGFLTGMWEALKEVGSILYDFLIAPLMSLGKVVVGIFTFDKDMIASGLADAASAAAKMSESAGARIAAAFGKGYKNGIDNFNKSSAQQSVKTPDAVSAAFASTSGAGAKGEDPMAATAKSGVNNITGGGTRTRNVTINLGKLFENITIQAQEVGQGADELADMVVSKLVQTLNTANQVQ